MEGDTVNKEVTETLGAMLPQVPLSGSTISYISDPYYELNDYINEGIVHDTKNAVTNLGNKVKVSGGVKTLLMKIAIQEKRIELAKTKKYYQKQVPKLEAELKLYKNKLERITRNATDEEKDDIEKTSRVVKAKVATDHKLQESVEEMYESGKFSTEELPENSVKSDIKVHGAPLILPKNKRAASLRTIAFKQIQPIANTAAKKAIALGMKDIVAEKRLGAEAKFSPAYVEYKKIKDKTGNIILYGDINDDISAVITAHIKDGSYAGYNAMASTKKSTNDGEESSVTVTSSEVTTEATAVSADGRINYFNQMIQETTAKRNQQAQILQKTTDGPTIAKIKAIIAQLDNKIRLFKRKIQDIQAQAANMKKPGMPGQAHSTAMQRPAFASTEDEPIDGEELTESKGEIAVVAGIAGSFVAGAVLNKAVRVYYQKKLNAYADAHSSDGLVHFNKFTKEKMSRSEIETYSKRFADKFDDPKTTVHGFLYKYKNKAQCAYIESQYSVTGSAYSTNGNYMSSSETGERKGEFVLISKECKDYPQYYKASMAVSHKIGDPVLKEFLKKARRASKHTGKFLQKKDELGSKLKDKIYGESVEDFDLFGESTEIDLPDTLDEYMESIEDTFFE